ncbi:MAG: DEAD/DEAH box helicase [Chloroflexi bacterium]|nr:DEAD/DEAH box helicase [Chloroflexota bacterium]
MNVQALIRRLTSSSSYQGQVSCERQIPSRAPRYRDPERPLAPGLQERLEQRGIQRLYLHQALALDLARSGANVMVSTPSASGKTLCYNLPVAETLMSDRWGRALYLFPTKALAQDQRRALESLFSGIVVNEDEFGVFDGDTPATERRFIKERAKVVLTNPDMLHLGILPHHRSWARLFRNLKYVVIDEAHIYRGVFGSHVSNVLRRLRRLCSYYGSNPCFIACSASIANPGGHAEKLVGVPFEVVDADGSPSGTKYFLFWNPPLLGEAKNARRSANMEAAALLADFIREGIRTLAFARTRRTTELMYLYIRNALASSPLVDKVMPYRAGYTAEDRRCIERRLFEGQLLGAIATNALELGIDIGDLDATLLAGYPGSVSSMWQQAGRSGRRRTDSVSMLVAADNPLDQYIMRHPEAFFEKPFESALINPENSRILWQHLLCASWELPLEMGRDEKLFGPSAVTACSGLAVNSLLVAKKSHDKDNTPGTLETTKFYPSSKLFYPAREVNLRSATQERFQMLDSTRGGVLLEVLDENRVFSEAYPGAIYLHQGDSFLVTDLDLKRRTVLVGRVDADYYTQPKEWTDVHIINTRSEKTCGTTSAYFGEVDVTSQTIGFRRKKQFTDEVLGEEPLDLPAQRFVTQAVWFSVPDTVVAQLAERGLDPAGALHAAEHASIGMLPLFALCDRNDIGGLSTPMHPDAGEPVIFIYDAYPGGIGIAEMGFEKLQQLWETTLKVISECPCDEGCPSCVYSPKCGNNNEPIDKEGARVLLNLLTTGGICPTIEASSTERR